MCLSVTNHIMTDVYCGPFPSVVFIPLSIGFTVYRVHWLRAKARYDRLCEDITLLHNEMMWTTDYFHYRSGLWKIYIQGIDAADDPGHLAYAY
jgi:hypothetical protein